MNYCLKDFVGLSRSCNYIPSNSGMYISQLPGMDAEWFDEVADAEQVTAVGLWDDVQETAADTFREDIQQEFGKRYLLRQITQSVDLNQAYDASILTTPIPGIKCGLLLQTKLQNNACSCSALQKLYVQSLSFFYHGTDPNPTIILEFQDADLLVVEYTVTQNVQTGWNTFWIDREFDAARLYVLVSGNFDSYVYKDLSNFFLQNFGNTFPGGWLGWGSMGSFLSFGFGGCGCQAMVQGVSYTAATNVAATGPNAFGVSVVFSTRCSYDSIVCSNKRQFASMWQHCVAIELLNYRIHSPRLNRWTTITKDQAISLRELLNAKYRGFCDDAGDPKSKGIDYPGKLQLGVTAISLNDADCCLKSNDRYIWREVRT